MPPQLVGSNAPRGPGNSPPGGGRQEPADDHERFRSVVLPHLSDAYSLARWLIGNPSDAEDVVQDACLRAYRGIAGFADGNARAWVLTIVRHTAYAWLQKNRHTALLSVDDLETVDSEEITTGPCAKP